MAKNKHILPKKVKLKQKMFILSSNKVQIKVPILLNK